MPFFASPPTLGIFQSADSVLDFHSQTIGQPYNTNFVQSDVWGNTVSWMVNSEGTFNTNIFTTIAVPSFPLVPPIRTPDGHVLLTTPTTGVRESLAEGANGTLILQYTIPNGANISSVRAWFMATNIDAPALNNHDQWQNLNPYGIAQFSFYNSHPGRLTVGYHSSIVGANPSAVPSVATNLWTEMELVTDVTNGFGFVALRDANTHAFLSSSIGYGTPEATLQTTFKFEGGYLYQSAISADFDRGISILEYNSSVPTNRPPWQPNAPSSLSAVQTGVGRASASFTDNNFLLNSNRVSFSNASGETVHWTTPAETSATLSGLTAGQTYDVRSEAYFIRGVKSSAATTTLAVTNWPVPITNGLMFRWLLNENTGTTLTDHSVNGYDGAFQGSSPTWVPVSSGHYGAVLNGTDNWLVKALPTAVSPVQAPPFTVSMWVSNCTAGHTLSIFSQNTGNWDGWLGVINTDGGINLYTLENNNFGDVSAGGASITFTPSAGWHHVVFVVTSASSKDVYYDGTKGTTDTGTYTPNQANYQFNIGANVRSGVQQFFANGAIDDVQVFDRVLTGTEIQYLYDKGQDGPPE